MQNTHELLLGTLSIGIPSYICVESIHDAVYNGAVDVIPKTFRWDEGLAPSFPFPLKGAFESKIVQRFKIYSLDSHLLKLVFLPIF